MFSLSKRSPKNNVVIRERQIEEDRMRDVELVLDCLYDVGSVNLVNRRVRSRPLNHLMKTIARLSKPAFRPFMMRWSRKNCPHLIASWLHSQVRFGPKDVLLPKVQGTVSDPTVQ